MLQRRSLSELDRKRLRTERDNSESIQKKQGFPRDSNNGMT